MWLSGPSQFAIEVNKYLICCFLLFSFYAPLKAKVHPFHPYILLLLTFSVFMCSRIVLDALALSDVPFNVKGWGIGGYFDVATSHKMLALVAFTLLFFNMGAYYAFLRTEKYASRSRENVHAARHIRLIREIGLGCFCVALIPYTIRLYTIFEFVITHGYTAVYLQPVINNPILSISDDICLLGLFLYFSTYPARGSTFYLLIFIYLIIIFSSMGGGSRGATMLSALSLVAYAGFRGMNFNRKVTFSVAAVGIALILVSQIMAVGRNSKFSSFSATSGNGDSFVTTFFVQQGLSICTIGFMIENEDKIKNKFLYFISPIFNPVRGFKGGNSEDSANNGYVLLHKLPYMVNPKDYLNGHGTGGSFIIDAYAAGGVPGVIIISFAWMFAVLYFVERYKYTWIGLTIILFSLPSILWAPRGMALGFVSTLPRVLLFIAAVQLLCCYAKNIKHEA